MIKLPTLLLGGLLLLANLSHANVQERFEFQSEQQQQLFRELTHELRCPKCQNQNIADSDAIVARDLRQKVFELVNQGQQKQQVIDYMVDRYGYFVHYKPPLTLGTLMLWLIPGLFLVLGLVVVWRRQRAQQRSAELAWTDRDEQQLQQLIAQIEQE